MKHEIHYIKTFRIVGLQTLQVVFENDDCKTINLTPVLHGEVYGPLKNPDFFKLVKLDEEIHNLVWPNGADFDPSTLYHWEQNVEKLNAEQRNRRIEKC